MKLLLDEGSDWHPSNQKVVLAVGFGERKGHKHDIVSFLLVVRSAHHLDELVKPVTVLRLQFGEGEELR